MRFGIQHAAWMTFEAFGLSAALAAPPNDPDFTLQWGLRNVGQLVNGKAGSFGADIAALDAWTIHSGGVPVRVAIVGAGVDAHPEFAERLLEGYVTPLAGGDPFSTLDTAGQGTRLAGIIAATSNNHQGIAGMNPRCWILPVRATTGNLGSSASVAQGIVWAAEQAADIILVPVQFPHATPALTEAVQQAVASGALVIAPAGDNGDAQVAFPAALPGCLAVSATTADDVLASFSNWGGRVDLAAPSENIWSTALKSGYAFESRGDAGLAAAYVAGAASLVWSYAPQLSAEDVHGILLASADDLGPPGLDPYFGHGRLNVARALQITQPPPVRFEPVGFLSSTLSPYETTPVFLRIANGTQRLISQSVQMIYRTIPGGIAPPLPASPMGDSLYRFLIPPMPCGTRLDYYYSARTDARLNYFDPPDAPFSLYLAAVGYPPPWIEDFEVDSGWSTVAEGGAETTGAWVRVEPNGTLLGSLKVQPEYDHTPDSGEKCFVTGQHFGGSPGANDVDGGPVRLISPLLFARAPDVEVAYAAWVFSLNADGEGLTDSLFVELSINNGATWIPVEAIGPTDGWQDRRFFFSDYSAARPDGFRLRFSIADLEFNSLTEAAIDDLMLIPAGCDWPGDADHDGNLDQGDWRRYAVCETGPDSSLATPDCFSMDIIRDGRVDLRDVAVFQNYFNP